MNIHDIELPEPAGHYYEWGGAYGKRKFTTAPHNGRECDRAVAYYTEDQVRAAIEADRKRRGESQEPFGYFRPGPFGWTDCAATDEGAIALYERPQAQGEPVAWVTADTVNGQTVNGNPRRVWWENKDGVGIPIYMPSLPTKIFRGTL